MSNRLLKNGHLAAVLESQFVTSACGLTLRAPSRSNFTSEIVRRILSILRGAFCGGDDLTILEQPEYFNSLSKSA